MKRTILAVVIAVAALAVIGAIVYANTNNDPVPVTDSSATSTTNDQASDQESTNTDEKNNDSSTSGSGSGSSDGGNTAPDAQTVDVTIKNYAFSPKELTVKKGTTVRWTNEDEVEHNAYSNSSGGPKGELLSKGESYSFTFNEVGTFDYVCTPHADIMKAKVTVTE